jgi:hypothetical protein
MLLFHCMKTSPKRLLPLTLFGIAVTSLFSVQPAQAYTVTLQQLGANVVANGSGPINLTGLIFDATSSGGTTGVTPDLGAIFTGPTSGLRADVYLGVSGPSNFGSGNATLASSGSGDLVGLFGTGGSLSVPAGYVSGNPLSDSMTFDHETIHSLGLTPGTYTWTWGTGLPNQNFTLIIPGVPDGGSTVSLLGFALLGLAAVQGKLRGKTS